MKIASFQPCSLNEYPGKVSSIVFTQGCNFRCYYCHNKELWGKEFIPSKGRKSLIPESSIFQDLDKLKGKICAVSISGGEPTIQEDLVSFVSKIKTRGFLVKLNTNGSKPVVIEELISKNLLDFVNMDIKSTKTEYREIAMPDYSFSLEDITRSIKLIRSSGIDHVFSVVNHSKLTGEDIVKIKKWVGPKNIEIRESII